MVNKRVTKNEALHLLNFTTFYVIMSFSFIYSWKETEDYDKPGT